MRGQIVLLALASSLLLSASVFMALYFADALVASLLSGRVRNQMARLEKLGVPARQLRLGLRCWGISLLVVAVLLLVVAQSYVLGSVVLVLLYMAPGMIVEIIYTRRRALLRDQMVGATRSLSNSLRAGVALGAAFRELERELNEPLASEMRRIANDFARGKPLRQAILDTKERLDLESFTLFAHAITICLERGGKVTEALDEIANTVQENQRLERKLAADTASGRRVIIMLAMFPVFFLGLFYFLDPVATGTLFATSLGQIVLAVVVLLIYGAAQWGRRILSFDAAM